MKNDQMRLIPKNQSQCRNGGKYDDLEFFMGVRDMQDRIDGGRELKGGLGILI